MVASSSADVTCVLRGCFGGGFVYVSFCLVSIQTEGNSQYNAVEMSSLIF